ncbi:MAG TPA: hypothetical protein VFY14_07135 [Streptomyces sp.]|nr:hypothetical protein [Streptomyces sp.]
MPSGDYKPACAGPRFIRRAELGVYPPDTLDRRGILCEEHGPGLCNITKGCTEICPEGIKITDNGITPMEERVVDHRHDPLRALNSRPHVSRPPRQPPGAELPHSAPIRAYQVNGAYHRTPPITARHAPEARTRHGRTSSSFGQARICTCPRPETLRVGLV